MKASKQSTQPVESPTKSSPVPYESKPVNLKEWGAKATQQAAGNLRQQTSQSS